MKRQDMLTFEDFEATRNTMKFANATNRIKYHNIKARELRDSISYINKPLHQNLKILNALMLNKTEAVFHKQFLLGCGFKFGVHTSVELYEKQNQYAIYNYILVPIDANQIKIIRND